jgi:hypothetical protein
MMKRLFPTLILIVLTLACVRTRRWTDIIEARQIDPEWRFDRKEHWYL